MKKPGLMLLGVMLAACSSTTEQPDDLPVLQNTTLTRFDGSRVSLEELDSLRPSGVATADLLAQLDRMLLEPGAEQRDAKSLIEDLRRAYPSETRMAQTLWETAEPPGRGNGRSPFREYGVYANQISSNGFGPRTRPSSLEAYAQEVLRDHTDEDDHGKLLAIWRRFAPLIRSRGTAYLASSWEIELEYSLSLDCSVGLHDSLLGPFCRASASDNPGPFMGMSERFEGYNMPMWMPDLIAPGPASPVGTAVLELTDLANSARSHLSFTVENGAVEKLADLEIDFLKAALTGLQDGLAEVEYLPQGVKYLSVVFSYLVGQAEARSDLVFERYGNGKWMLARFEYEPAAANMIGNGARLDLMPTIRALLLRNKQG